MVRYYFGILGEDYFEKFYGMKPYLEINEEEWQNIKDMYTKDEVKEKLADLCMTYPLPYQTEKYTEENCRDDYFKLKGIRWNELLRGGQVW